MKELQLASGIDAGSNFESVPMDLGDFTNYAVQVEFSSATLNGTLALEGSLDKTVWTTIPDSTQTVTSGGPHLWSATTAGYRYVKAVWTRSSGTGTATIKALLKETPIKGA